MPADRELPLLDWRHGYQCTAVAAYSGLQCSCTARFLLDNDPVCGHHKNPLTTETRVWKPLETRA